MGRGCVRMAGNGVDRRGGWNRRDRECGKVCERWDG